MSLLDRIMGKSRSAPVAKEEPKTDVPNQRTSNAPPADSRLFLARRGKPGKYRGHTPDGDKVIVQVMNFEHPREKGRVTQRVYPGAHYRDGECVKRAPRTKDGRELYLPGSVLVGKFNCDRLPDAYRDLLEPWAEIIMDAARAYDESQKRRKHRA